DPVAPRKAGGELRGVDLPGRPPADEHCVQGCLGADLGPHDVAPARGAVAARTLARAVAGGRHPIRPHDAVVMHEAQRLAVELDLDLHRRAAKKACRSAALSAASTPPCTCAW